MLECALRLLITRTNCAVTEQLPLLCFRYFDRDFMAEKSCSRNCRNSSLEIVTYCTETSDIVCGLKTPDYGQVTVAPITAAVVPEVGLRRWLCVCNIGKSRDLVSNPALIRYNAAILGWSAGNKGIFNANLHAIL